MDNGLFEPTRLRRDPLSFWRSSGLYGISVAMLFGATFSVDSLAQPLEPGTTIQEILEVPKFKNTPKNLFHPDLDSRAVGRSIAWRIHLLNEEGSDEFNPVFDFFRDTEIQMAFPSGIVSKIVSASNSNVNRCFLNLHQVGHSTGFQKPHLRRSLEDNLAAMRLYYYGDHSPAIKALVNEVRPKYAYLGLKKRIADQDVAKIFTRSGHGNVYAVFKDEVKKRSTFTPFDSFRLLSDIGDIDLYERKDSKHIHSFYYRPNQLGFDPLQFGDGYWEAQIWGRLCFVDVAFFLVNCGPQKIEKENLNLLIQTGVPVYQCGTQTHPGGALKPEGLRLESH